MFSLSSVLMFLCFQNLLVKNSVIPSNMTCFKLNVFLIHLVVKAWQIFLQSLSYLSFLLHVGYWKILTGFPALFWFPPSCFHSKFSLEWILLQSGFILSLPIPFPDSHCPHSASVLNSPWFYPLFHHPSFVTSWLCCIASDGCRYPPFPSS